MTEAQAISTLITKYEMKRDALLKEAEQLGMCYDQRVVLGKCAIVEDIIHDLNKALYPEFLNK